MSEQTDNILSRLSGFGLEADEARVYLHLLEKGSLTALIVSRDLNISRTRVYRLLDRLIAKELVIQKLDTYGFKFTASEPSQLKNLLIKRESELESLKQSLPETQRILAERLGGDLPGSKVYYYRGADGLSRVNWNLLNAKGEVLSYEVNTVYAYLPETEVERLTNEMILKKISMRTISNKMYLNEFPEITETTDKLWKIRHISEKVFDIKTDVFIYNDVFAVCHYLEKGDVFCFEMHNQQVAQMQRQIFEQMWTVAKPLCK